MKFGKKDAWLDKNVSTLIQQIPKYKRKWKILS